MAVEQAAVVPRSRTYPHLGSFDQTAQAAIRILYDQIFTLQERLTAAETTITSLLAAVNTLQTATPPLQVQVDHALTPTQET